MKRSEEENRYTDLHIDLVGYSDRHEYEVITYTDLNIELQARVTKTINTKRK